MWVVKIVGDNKDHIFYWKPAAEDFVKHTESNGRKISAFYYKPRE